MAGASLGRVGKAPDSRRRAALRKSPVPDIAQRGPSAKYTFELSHRSNAKTLFQSSFMFTIDQPLAKLSSSALSSLPMCDLRS